MFIGKDEEDWQKDQNEEFNRPNSKRMGREKITRPIQKETDRTKKDHGISRIDDSGLGHQDMDEGKSE